MAVHQSFKAASSGFRRKPLLVFGWVCFYSPIAALCSAQKTVIYASKLPFFGPSHALLSNSKNQTPDKLKRELAFLFRFCYICSQTDT